VPVALAQVSRAGFVVASERRQGYDVIAHQIENALGY
jgi:hypothetical protein